MKARFFDKFGLLIGEIPDIGRPIPSFRYVSEEERMELFRVIPPGEPLIDNAPRPRTYLFIGVEVDKHGTWARYVTRDDR